MWIVHQLLWGAEAIRSNLIIRLFGGIPATLPLRMPGGSGGGGPGGGGFGGRSGPGGKYRVVGLLATCYCITILAPVPLVTIIPPTSQALEDLVGDGGFRQVGGEVSET